jgi:MYXO-CTERM domain-containing protein
MDAAGGASMTGEDAAVIPPPSDDAAAPNGAQYDTNGGGCACRQASTQGSSAGAWLLAMGLALVLAGRSRSR